MSQARSIKALNNRLKEASCIYLEHHQFANGFDFLDKVVTSGISNGNGRPSESPVFVPLPSQLALAATLIVHPSYTTRGTLEEQSMSDRALVFLHHCLDTLGPTRCPFTDAFQFHVKKVERRRGRRTQNSVSEEDETLEDLTTPFVNGKSLFSQTESFWHVVGWAFNCAHHFPARWSRWMLLLNFWLDVAHVELDACIMTQTFPEKGVLASMFKSAGERHEQRRVMRAIFADGGQVASNEFGEVYLNETKAKKKVINTLAKRQKVNLDEDQWGDFGNEQDGDDIEMEDAPSNTRSDSSVETTARTDRIHLQSRFISLILSITTLHGSPFRSAPAVVDWLTELIKPLVLDDFIDLLCALDAPIQPQLALLLNTIEVYLPSAVPKTNLLHVDTPYISKYFFHEEARTANAVDNAKLSILVEYVIGLLLDQDKLHYSEHLYRLVRRGIDARLKKADLNRRGKNRSAQEMEAEQQLKFSGDRIIAYMALLKDPHPVPPPPPSAAQHVGAGSRRQQLEREESVSSVLSSPPASDGMSLPNMSRDGSMAVAPGNDGGAANAVMEPQRFTSSLSQLGTQSTPSDLAGH